MKNYNIRSGTVDDVDYIVKVFIIAGREILRWILGPKFKTILLEAVSLKTSPFSWSKTYVIESDSKFAGAVITYPMDSGKILNAGINNIFQKHLNVFEFFGLIYKIRKWEKNVKKPMDCYYIHAISVFENYRGQGLAGKLLEHVQNIALEEDYHSIYLEVISSNTPALKAYQKFGFLEISRLPVSKFSRKFSNRKNEYVIQMKKYFR